MRKMSVVIIVLAGFLTTSSFLGLGGTKADDGTMTNNEPQVLNDEGYGNTDEEYYNSEDDREEIPGTQNEAIGNIDEGPSGSQENVHTKRSNREY